MLNKFLKGDRTKAYSDSLSSQVSLTCRLIVGGYLLYLAYGLVGSVFSETVIFRQIMFGVAIACFTLAGGYFTYSSGRDLVIGRYVGGKLDLGEKPEEKTEVVAEMDIKDKAE